MTKNSIQVISTTEAPGAIGPYSQAIRMGDFLFSSGQLGIDAATGTMPATVEEQAECSLCNVKSILEAAGTDMNHVIKTTVFLQDMNDFQKVNDIYARFFTQPFPARSAVQVARLPKDGLVEIEVIAAIE